MRMAGRVCLVTGTTSGIGRVTARELAAAGATLVMVCRSRDRAEAVRTELQRSSPGARVDVIVADMGDMEQVRRAAAEFRAGHDSLHVLVHNAGAIHAERQVAPGGLERTFAANYLGPFLLTHLLLDVLRASAPARVINVSSAAHSQGRINFDDLQGARRYSAWRAYAQSKLAQLLFTYELSSRLEGSGVTVNALHPGIVSSNFNNGLTGIARAAGALFYRVAGIDVEQGARTTLHLAMSPEVEAVTGKYFVDCKQVPSSGRSHDPAVGSRLWQVSESLVGVDAGSAAAG